MDTKIKIGGVSYLNALPMLRGIEQSPVIKDIELSMNYPSILAQQLRYGLIDIALLPVAAIPAIEGAHIVADYGIAAYGEVASVAIFSQVPMEDIESVYLDYQSRTSVMLARLLLRDYWKKEVVLKPATEHFIEYIKDKNAGVIIGDRALKQRNNFNYVYDLAAAWKDYTGLPFVFAAWVANRELPADFVDAFNEANAAGMKSIDQIVSETLFPYYDLKKYYTENIHYYLDEEKKKGLNKFLELIQTL